MTAIAAQYKLRGPTPYVTKLPNNTGMTIASQELIGIEVEVENSAHLIDGDRAAGVDRGWVAKGDGSLRNGGVEFVSQPIPADTAPQMLDNLMRKLTDGGCCFSPRTSVHIHLDFSGNDTEDVFNNILLYSVFEKLFYKFVGRKRINNVYCVPLTQTALLIRMAAAGVRARDWQKYTGLNLRTLENYGTIEYRHMHGTAELEKLCVWVDLITRLKEYCLKTGTKKIRSTVANLDEDSNFVALLDEIFGNRANYLKYESFEDVRDTYMVAKSLLTKPNASIGLIQAEGVHRDAPFYNVRSF